MKRILLACLLLTACARASARHAPEALSFVHITDTHLTASSNVGALEDLVRRVNAMAPLPAFVVDTGDVTEAGRPEEFQRFQQAVKPLAVPIYCAPGNHDVRWNPLGKEGFADVFGKLYQSFDAGGCHFVVLDSTVVLEHWGHFDAAELNWLEKDLKKLKRGTPVFLFFHHPIGNSKQVDNEEDLLRRIAPYNIAAIFVGHGHSDLEWKVNGIPCFEARGLYQGSFHRVEVTPSSVRVYRLRKEENWKPALIATLPTSAPPRPRIAFGWDDPNVAVLERRQFLAELRTDAGPVTDERVQAQYALDEGPLQPMERDLRRFPGRKGPSPGRFLGRFDTAPLGDGAHVLTLYFTAPDGTVYRRREPFVVERVSGHPKQEWSFDTGDIIQSSPAASGSAVFVTSFDGRVYALDASTGRRRWAASTRGPIYASPLVTADAVFVGSLDHFFYALDARSGRVRWKFDTGSPIFATAAEANGVICIGSNRRIYGLDAVTGKSRWTVETGGFFQSRAAAMDGVFFLGGWDNAVYAVDAQSGALKWKASMGRTDGGRGALSFYYSPAIASPAAAHGRVYVCTNDGLLHCLDAGSGSEEWAVRAPQGKDVFGYSSPMLQNGRVYVGGLGEAGRGNVYALDAKTGTLMWESVTKADRYDASPAVAGPWIAIGSTAGVMTWLDPASGKVGYQYRLDPGFCFSTPASDGTLTFIGSFANRVYALRVPAAAP
ncbi:MAG: PQQ-binding-like beta-propeller repeat protein [Chthonomonadales bacterium]